MGTIVFVLSAIGQPRPLNEPAMRSGEAAAGGKSSSSIFKTLMLWSVTRIQN